MNKIQLRIALSLFLINLISCSEQTNVSPSEISESPVIVLAPIKINDTSNDIVTYENNSLSFTGINAVYEKEKAKNDFGDLEGEWQAGNTMIFDQSCRVVIPANSTFDQKNENSGNGNSVNIHLPLGTEYELSYKVKFAKDFDWSKGGSLGFGLSYGEGKEKALEGEGGEISLNWVTDKSGNASFVPSTFIKDSHSSKGTSFDAQSSFIQKGTWYTVKMRFKTQTEAKSLGDLLITVDNKTLLQKSNFVIAKNTKSSFINKIAFHTFRHAGKENASNTNGEVFYDDVSWRRISQ
ncbi:MAG: polysaccharide lyase [Leadbetterella sp.]